MYFVVVNGFICRFSTDSYSSGCNLMRRRSAANQSTCILLFVWRICSGGLLSFEHRHRALLPWQCCGSRLDRRFGCCFFVGCLRISLEGDVTERRIFFQCKWDPQVCGIFLVVVNLRSRAGRSEECFSTFLMGYGVLCSCWRSMAGSAPEGSQFDARQYDAKMDSMYVKLSPVPPRLSSQMAHLENLLRSLTSWLFVAYRSLG